MTNEYVREGERTDKLTTSGYETSPDGQLVLKNGYPVNNTSPIPILWATPIRTGPMASLITSAIKISHFHYYLMVELAE